MANNKLVICGSIAIDRLMSFSGLFSDKIKPDKLDAYKAFFEKITGPRKEEYTDLLNRYGLKSAKVWYHKIAGKEHVMVLHETEDDAMERLKNWSSSTNPFDRWFDEQCLNCYDIKSLDNVPEQPEFLYKFDTDR